MRGGSNVNFTSDKLESILFCQSWRGYNKKQVDEVMSKIIEDYRKIDEELNDYRNRVSLLEENLEHYKTIEESMQHCLVIAHHTGEEMVSSASDKAKNIVRESELQAEKMINDAQQEINNLKYAYEEAKSKIYTFKVQTEALLNAQLDVLKQILAE
jgi:cell division initiation protein